MLDRQFANSSFLRLHREICGILSFDMLKCIIKRSIKSTTRFALLRQVGRCRFPTSCFLTPVRACGYEMRKTPCDDDDDDGGDNVGILFSSA